MDSTTTTGNDAGPPEFRAFAAARSHHLIRTAYLLTGGDAHLAEDLAQEALGKLYGNWRRISRMANPAGYARTVLVNTFLSHRRRRSSREHVTDTFAETAAPPADPALRVTLLQALAELPQQDRAVLILRYWEDLGVEETADALRLTPSAVRSRASRALGRLRTRLGEQFDELARP
ncbi:SigE family RNA polymerase sigma factor [Kitasatospora cheerisanensis]|uniref:RNA polymerase sigma24 factor n=1 Tax=Kitasatospora cheerisanensis KCTC 2395 TaxID=1348663 RepID=A0A066YVH2_9ACTN|nr:SigE family RNA polymerase sigma factor [Kitasatospora cheerisanensis]KDN82091.1 RNA polymerase sigma24 factor [Kitasatospora cheerisanensis KCTC 2395]